MPVTGSSVCDGSCTCTVGGWGLFTVSGAFTAICTGEVGAAASGGSSARAGKGEGAGV